MATKSMPSQQAKELDAANSDQIRGHDMQWPGGHGQ